MCRTVINYLPLFVDVILNPISNLMVLHVVTMRGLLFCCMNYFILFAGVYCSLLAPGSKSDVIFRLLQFLLSSNILIHYVLGQPICWPACSAVEEGNREPYIPSTFRRRAGPHSPVLGNLEII